MSADSAPATAAWPFPIHDVDPSDPNTMGCTCTCDGCRSGRCHVRDRSSGGTMSVSQQNARGEWVPAIPEPLFFGWRLRRCRCKCGETFRDRASYQGHYALAHILAVKP